MYQEIAQLLMYGITEKNEILYQMGEIFARFEIRENGIGARYQCPGETYFESCYRLWF